MSKRQFERWEKGEILTRSQSMAANCYVCNGYSMEMVNDCLGKETCCLYPWSPWGKKSRPVNLGRSRSVLERIKRGRAEPEKGQQP